MSEKQRWTTLVAGTGACLLIWRRRRSPPRAPPRALPPSEFVTSAPPGASWTSDAGGELQRGYAAEGAASLPAETVGDCVARLENEQSHALAWEEGSSLPTVASKVKYTYATWAEYVAETRAIAKAFIALGLKPRQSVCILGFNCKEWLVADLAAILAGGFASGIYSTNGSDAVGYIVEHCGAAIVCVENEKQLMKLDASRAFPSLKAVVMWGGPDLNFGDLSAPLGASLLRWRDCVQLGTATTVEQDAELASRVAAQRAGHCCTLIYTSGTTGNPKAVMVSHDNITWVVRSFAAQIRFGCAPGGRERVVSYLPLSHIAAQAIDIFAGLATVGRQVGGGGGAESPHMRAATVYFARQDALKGSLTVTLQACRPTVFFGVPRVWEKMAEGIQAKGAQITGFKKTLSTWAKKVMLARYQRRRADCQTEDLFEGVLPMLSRGVQEALAFKLLSKAHYAVGLDQTHFVFTGAAPIATSVLEYFGSLGLTVNEAFGMSEVSGPACVTLNEFYAPGTCGPAIPGVEIKIDYLPGRDKPGEGEVCFRGRLVMLGYLGDAAKSCEAIDADGWEHSGDTGRLDELQPGAAPVLRITGRIKELLITAGGENVAPVPIEDALKSSLPGVSTAVVIGDKLKFLSVLLTLKQQPCDLSGSFLDELTGAAAVVDPEATTAKQAAKSDAWRVLVKRAIDKYNKTASSSAQKVQKFHILPRDFSQATGELTPTLKLKRAFVVEKYSDVIKMLYGDFSSGVWSS